MLPSTLTLYLISLLQATYAIDVTHRRDYSPSLQRRASRNVPPDGFYNPYVSGGKLLTLMETYPPNQGEPLNAVISGNSDERVLVDQEVEGGLRNYFLSLGFSGNCLGQKPDSFQAANLGDGNGDKNETSIMRWNYGDAQLGSCKETIQGGNHFRYWIQDGKDANSGAIFMATSYEKPIADHHDIIPDGYNLGRDWLVGNITRSEIKGPNITDGMTFSGNTSWSGYTYNTFIKYVGGILPNTSDGVNHNYSVPVDGINASDGWLAVLEVKIVEAPSKSNSAINVAVPPPWQLLSSLVALAALPSSLQVLSML
ncbi:hypothetical protein DFP72DRAFT_895253 [Ephemerocybe angulata]|uniref:Uncharacterized protein n=1 Tax=Ephemerocybe angulata TaxID=980116 RepID=A0A8H6I1S5_9AGAR|nr:hypothetical protein DFP72DRAFT_895253 [Tulosesus angulatus]